MNIEFSKYQGAGNDFVMIDNQSNFFLKDNHTLIANLCDRRFGIGADGLILLEEDKDYDFRMVYYNADGNESTMCGNGGRCIVAFAKQIGVIKNKTKFIAIDGEHIAEVLPNGEVALGMIDVDTIEKISDNEYFLFTGSPHYVKVVDSFPDNFVEEAKAIRNNSRFKKEGVNVNYIVVNKNEVPIRTYERGVEDETLACGTGATAGAIIASLYNNKVNNIMKAVGGDLTVRFSENYNDVVLQGPAQKVFEGKL